LGQRSPISVIAIENVAFDRDAASALSADRDGEVLQVINSSPGELAPVFEMILEKRTAFAGRARRLAAL